MAKTNITQYSSTPSSNTDINNINIDENCPASGLNNAIRELMAHLKNVDTGSQALTALSVTGDTTISSGNLLVGTTNSLAGINNTDQGISLRTSTGSASSIAVSRDTGISGYFNRNSDGDILSFRRDGSAVGSIGAWSSSLLVGTGDVGLAFVDGTPERIQPRKADDQTSADGLIDLGHSSNRFKDLYLSGGVYLGGTASANLLDSYEEGTWSPTISFGTATFAGTYYVKIGTQVTVWANVNDITATTGNDITIGNLPFTSRTQAGNVGSVLWRYFARTSAIDMISYITSNSTNIQFFWCFNNDGDYDKVTYADGSGSQDMDMIITITYQTS